MLNTTNNNKVQSTNSDQSLNPNPSQLQKKPSTSNSYFSKFTSLINYGHSESSQGKTRKLNENRTFERIIEASNHDGYVYSNNAKYYVPGDGILIGEYLKTIDPEIIDFYGSLTKEQTQIVGIETFPYTITLLEYFIYHYVNNLQNKLKINYEEIASTLIQKGASFDSNLVTKANEVKIDLVKIWCQKHKIDILESSVNDIIFVANSRELTPIIYRYLYEQPLENIYPSFLKNDNFKNFANLFIKVLEDRINATQANLKKNEDKAKDMLQHAGSINNNHILQSCNLSQDIARQSHMISKLEYVLNVAKTQLKTQELWNTNVKLTDLLNKRQEQSTKLARIEAEIQNDMEFFEAAEEESLGKERQLLHEAKAYSEKWPSNIILTSENIIQKNKEEARYKQNYSLYQTHKENLDKKKQVIDSSEQILSQEKDTLNELESQITKNDKMAEILRKEYDQLIQDRSKENVFNLPAYNSQDFDIVRFNMPSDLTNFLYDNYTKMDQKFSIMKSAIRQQKWSLINPILASGLSEDTFSNKKALFACFIINYEQTAFDLMITMYQTNPGSFAWVLKNKDTYDMIDYDTSPLWSYLLSKHSKRENTYHVEK